ncbi:membrane protein [Alphaproteobacteria bacterium]|nr:membrane protein [Alphaproteobacteria bacterium]GHS96807.1 membrane protein [Alphaproteobacteria bacterium]
MNPHSSEQVVSRRTESLSIDKGLQAYMVKIFNYMALGLAVSGGVAYGASTSQALMKAIFNTPLMWVVLFAPLLFVLFLGPIASRLSAKAVLGSFVAYAATMGLSLSSIFFVFAHDSIVSVFGVSAALFLSMSLYGHTTKRDLTSMGSFLSMGVFGLIIAMVINIFMKNSMLEFVLSFLAIGIFTGLTAYDVQRLRSVYSERHDSETLAQKAVFGALMLYLDFVNIFLHMLRLFGRRS